MDDNDDNNKILNANNDQFAHHLTDPLVWGLRSQSSSDPLPQTLPSDSRNFCVRQRNLLVWLLTNQVWLIYNFGWRSSSCFCLSFFVTIAKQFYQSYSKWVIAWKLEQLRINIVTFENSLKLHSPKMYHLKTVRKALHLFESRANLRYLINFTVLPPPLRLGRIKLLLS